METCEDCGFAWERVADDEITPRIDAGVTAIVAAIGADPERSLVRPEPATWSGIEYASHVRDVLLTIRDRTVIGIVQHEPHFSPLYREERVDRGLYAADTVDEIALELPAAAAMYRRLWDAIPVADRDRLVHYGWPDPALRSLRWMGQQAVHEVEHHRTDIQAGLTRVAPPG